MTYVKKFTVFFIAATFFCSCGASSSGNKLVGTWELVESNGEKVKKEGEITPLLIFTEDGKFFEEQILGTPKTMSISYTISGKDTLVLSVVGVEESPRLTFSFEGNHLILKIKNDELKLIRRSEKSILVQPKDESPLIGKWDEIGGKEKVEFFKGGTVSIAKNSRSIAGDFKVIDVGRLRFDLGGIGKAKGPMILTVSIIGDILIMTEENGKTTKYKNMKRDDK